MIRGGPVSSSSSSDSLGSSSGCRDHVVFYRPGAGVCSVLKRDGADFKAIYSTTTDGIGGFDFKFSTDRAFAFDYDHSGKVDHIVCFRGGAGSVFILKHDGNGNFAPVFAEYGADGPSPDGGNGIAGWTLAYPWDRMMAFDFDKTGNVDCLFIYQREQGHFMIVRNYNGYFGQAYREWCWGTGSSGFRAGTSSYYALAMDWTHAGRLDHIIMIEVNTANLLF